MSTTAQATTAGGLVTTARTMGKDLMTLVLQQLRSQPDHWMRMSETQQKQAIESIRTGVQDCVNRAAAILLHSDYGHVEVEIEGIQIKEGVKIGLSMPSDDPGRHALYDAKGKKMILVMVEAQRWLDDMENFKAQPDNLDLFSGDYDPAKDQPKYRRDEPGPSSAPGFVSWADLKASLAAGTIKKKDAEKIYGGKLPDVDPLDTLGADITSKRLPGIIQARAKADSTNEAKWVVVPLPQVPDDKSIRETLSVLHVDCEFRFVPDGAVHDPEPTKAVTITVNGAPLESVGVDKLEVMLPDGTRQPIVGFEVKAGMTMENALIEMLKRDFPEGSTIVSKEPPKEEQTTNQGEKVADLAEPQLLHERLFGIGMQITLGKVKKLSIEQRGLVKTWLDEYDAWHADIQKPDTAMPQRPHFLPLFTPLERKQ